MTEKLGIVYTPVEVVDFIIHSVNDVLKKEFGETLGSKGVHIIDPFTGTGTFVTRLLQSGLIKQEELTHKYKNEIHANEIVLLAYYIAAINIEAAFHGIAGGDYIPFEGICLTDTFQLYEKEDLFSTLLEDNSERRKRQKKLDIRVIMGNPPYSVGQDKANDDNANVEYPTLDQRIRSTYAFYSTATNKNALYDSYIRAFRWATDRIGDRGIIGYVSNGGWIDGNTTDGLRKCMVEGFSSLYIFHLRGNARTSGEIRRKEKDNVFGQGTRTPVVISILVKNPSAREQGKIYFHDIGDYLTREQKLEIISDLKSVNGIDSKNAWQHIIPDKHNDWVNQRDDSFEEYMSIGDKNANTSNTIFEKYSNGLKTQRDSWCYNSSQKILSKNIRALIAFYNDELARYKSQATTGKAVDIDKFIKVDSTKISWTRATKADFEKKKSLIYTGNIVPAAYRPFMKQHLYFDRRLNEMVYQIPRFFPDAKKENLIISVNANWTGNGQIAFMSNALPDLHFNGDAQCFPLYFYESIEDDANSGLFKSHDIGERKKHGITNEGLAYFATAYPSEKVTKEDVFYYVYGLLHSTEYLEKYADNLSKQLPRIPRVKRAEDFWTFSKAGRDLAELHVNYEKVKPYSVSLDTGGNKLTSFGEKEFYVTKMKFAKKGDKCTVVYNSYITIKDIPVDAFDYIVNGKAALEWVMERQSVKTDKDSGIVNDANLYATETVGNPAYPLELLLRVITVSIETMKIIKSLPSLDILPSKPSDLI
jgi:predicted helicase